MTLVYPLWLLRVLPANVRFFALGRGSRQVTFRKEIYKIVEPKCHQEALILMATDGRRALVVRAAYAEVSVMRTRPGFCIRPVW